MSKGIYCYVDNETGLIDYIGKDSNIHKNKRHKDHYQPSNYEKQPFNRILQNNPNRWEYQKLYESDDVDDETLNQLEITFIKRYNPRFNFTKGGDGVTGYKEPKSKEHKQNISKALKGNKNNLGNNHSEETKLKMSESKKGENNPMYGKYGDKHHSWKSYSRIVGGKKQPYELKMNGKRLKRSKYIFNLINWFFENYPKEPLHLEVK